MQSIIIVKKPESTRKVTRRNSVAKDAFHASCAQCGGRFPHLTHNTYRRDICVSCQGWY